ncbi:hypothetical protein JFT60_11150 [Pseudomonas sp. MF6772]|jgi:hypothetical protein|uniref:Secreted protein n=1 Tax=Pseudomonas shahriarae TaxID=2745512 RepID=A0ABT5NIT4_9PSED|nr:MULTISPECIES: hypothetical protein [Pseudomonas]SUD43418.1 Uncharacterised protein [Pseudomonas fluorescens]MBJ2263279.1 hypothetical protein [Pseudomonas sp. MF6787]MBJ2267924.1 hypothetical protein [Pseudomonas sp. MF6772]MBJ2290806.1 hypothetical protein [Pseudomonas sp. MF5691]MBK3439478.1 hypothetical protein [Pseudomonas sp. MF7448]
MTIKTRKYLMIFTLCALATALYGTAAYRAEQARMQPGMAATCNHGQCTYSATLSALR